MNEKSFTCCGKEIHSSVLMKSHLELVHGIDPSVTMFSERMIYHMDAAKWYLTVYELSGGGITFTRSEKIARDKEGKILWDGQ